jgi:hypothetical protein
MILSSTAGTFHQKNSSESNALSKRSASKGFSMSASAPADSFFVYIIRCADGSFYVGHTSNVDDRIKVHNDGRGALWTACRRPVTLLYRERCANSTLIFIAPAWSTPS